MGYNPANWMLEVSSPGNEVKLGVDFAQIYENSQLCKCVSLLNHPCSLMRRFVSACTHEHTHAHAHALA